MSKDKDVKTEEWEEVDEDEKEEEDQEEEDQEEEDQEEEDQEEDEEDGDVNYKAKYEQKVKEFDTLEQRRRDQDSYNSKIKSESLETMKKIKEKDIRIAELSQVVKEDEDGYVSKEDLDKHIELATARKEKEQLLKEQASIGTEEYVKSQVNDFEDLIDDIAELALKDGESQSAVDEFKRNPYKADPKYLVNLGTKALLLKENKQLKDQIGQKAKGVEKHLEAVEKAAGSRSLTNTQGDTVVDKGIEYSEEDIEKMSVEDSTAFILKMQKKFN